MKLVRSHDVMDIASATGKEAPIFPTAKRYPDPICGHRELSSPCVAAVLQVIIFIITRRSLFGLLRPAEDLDSTRGRC
jgi:hypothetical protein